MLSLALLLGCTGESPTTVSTGADAIPDPFTGLPTRACENSGVVENVATAWFIGQVQIRGSTFSGTETAAVHWSPQFVAECGYVADCDIVWTLDGTVVTAGLCADCPFALQITATLDPALTDCPAERLADFQAAEWTDTFDVRKNDDATTELLDTQTGALIGGWYWAGTQITWVDKAAICSPYPDDLATVCGG